MRGPGENWLGWCRSGLDGSVANRGVCVFQRAPFQNSNPNCRLWVRWGSGYATERAWGRHGEGSGRHMGRKKTHTGRFERPQAASEHPALPHLCPGPRTKLCAAPLGSNHFPQKANRELLMLAGALQASPCVSREADATRFFGPRAQQKMPRWMSGRAAAGASAAGAVRQRQDLMRPADSGRGWVACDHSPQERS